MQGFREGSIRYVLGSKRGRPRVRESGNLTKPAMLEEWRQLIPREEAHFRELASLPGTRERELPIEKSKEKIAACIREHSICGIRSPPGSGKTMVLPEVLYDWAQQRDEWTPPQAVMIVTVSRPSRPLAVTSGGCASEGKRAEHREKKAEKSKNAFFWFFR